MERITVPAERLPNGITRMQVIDSRKVKEHAMELYWRLKEYEDTGLSPEDVTDLMGSHAMAIGELAKTLKWIPVTERLPENFVSVLGYMTDAGPFPPVRECYTIGKAFYFPALLDVHPVSHWMPLPEPPKEDTK